MKAKDNTFIAGKAAINNKTATPNTPTVFFSKTEALITVSVASVNILPNTGTKLPVINFAVRIVMPSVIAAYAPCTEITPRKIVKNEANKPMLMFLSNPASWVTLY